MRTKTLALSALLGLIGSASLMAQSTNVYSLNAVGYINVTLYPGYNIITCPLICSPDNTLNTLLNNSNGQYQVKNVGPIKAGLFYSYQNGVGFVATDSADTAATTNANGWALGGTESLMPGQGAYFYNPGTPGTGTNMYATWVGQVPQNGQYNMTNSLPPGYNIVGSIVPTSGDIITNSIMAVTNVTPTKFDTVYVFDPTYSGSGTTQWGYTGGGGATRVWSTATGWNEANTASDPTTASVYEGFWYFNNSKTVTNNWVENFTINP